MRFTKCSHCGRTMKHHVNPVNRVNTCNNYKCAMYRKSPAKKIDSVIQHGNAHDCRTQGVIFFNFAISINLNHTHLQLGVNHKAIYRVYGVARVRVAREVMWRQPSMTLNDSSD
eukprot:6490491-Amphidinium_carterae.2